MATARQQAREAADKAALPSTPYEEVVCGRVADAASDVWEPIVRELIEHLVRCCEQGEECSWIAQAREALGE